MGRSNNQLRAAVNYFGADAGFIRTFTASPQPGGAFLAEGNGLITTKDGDAVMVWIWSAGRATGA